MSRDPPWREESMIWCGPTGCHRPWSSWGGGPLGGRRTLCSCWPHNTPAEKLTSLPDNCGNVSSLSKILVTAIIQDNFTICMLLARLLDSPSIFLQFPLQLALLLDPPASLSLHTPASCHYLPLPMSLLRVLSKLSRHIKPRPSYRPLLPLFDLLTKLFTPPWSAISYTCRSSHI